MLSAACSGFCRGIRIVPKPIIASTIVRQYAAQHHVDETPEDFDQRYVDFFNRTDLDSWWLRKGMIDLHLHDLIPEPKITVAILRACRRQNDLAAAIRWMECLRIKCGPRISEIYPWLEQELKPVMDELGVPTLSELGYDKPEFWLPNRHYWFPETDDEHTPSYHTKTGCFNPLIANGDFMVGSRPRTYRWW